jgi:hypothetical protein
MFARFGAQDDEVEVNCDALLSAGLEVRGRAWGRPSDAIGLGYSYPDSGSGNIKRAHVLAGYARFRLGDYSELSLAIQRVHEDIRTGQDRDGAVYGVRFNAYF